MFRTGILLTGCGAQDGSDIHEVAFVALALERALIRTVCLAPPGPQHDVVDHAAGTVDDAAGPRDVLVESARLARGRVEEFGAVALSDLSALIVAGGIGAAKNLFDDVLVPGRRARLKDAIAGPLAAFRQRGGVLAAIGLGQLVLAALDEGFEADPLSAAPDRAVADAARRMAWAPGLLGARSLDETARGIDELVKAVAALVRGPEGTHR